jgi:type I restriction enzyme M protein
MAKQYPEITSIVSLPKDVFENILFHSEVLIFNMPQLKGHYFVHQR